MSQFLRMDDARPLLQQWKTPGFEGEVLLKQSVSRVWSLANGIFQTRDGLERGGAVRVVLEDGRASLVTATAPSLDGLAALLEQAVSLARQAAPDPHQTLAPAPPSVDGLQAFTSNPGPPPELSAAEGSRDLMDRVLERGHRLAPHGITLLRAWVRQAEVVTELANSRGFAGNHRTRLFSVGLLLAEDSGGAEPLVHEESYTAGEIPRVDHLLESALIRATGLFGPPAPAPRSPDALVLTPEAAGPLLLALGEQFVPRPHGGCRNTLPPVGARVAREGITLADDGLHPTGLRTAPFDGEGTPTARTLLVKDGILQTMVHDRRSGSRSGSGSTGNAVRDSYRQWPSPGLTTLVLCPQPEVTEDDLFSDIREGFLAVEASPPDPDRLESGLFSQRLRGRLIRNGRLGCPTVPVTLRLPLEGLLPRIAAATGRPKLVALDGCVETPLVRLEEARLEI